MPELSLAPGIAGRESVGLPSALTVNCYAEPTPAGPKKVARIGRPGLTSAFTIGAGPILRQFQTPGLFGGAVFSISAGQLYMNDTLLGDIPYGVNPRMAAANNQLAIVSGGALYVYNGTTLSLIRYFNDGVTPLPAFSGVAVLYDVFVFPITGGPLGNYFYYSAAGDATNISASNISSAQTTPDPIVDVQVLGEELYFVKEISTEIWDYNPIENAAGQVTAVFQESQGRSYIRGTAAQGSVVSKLDNALFWVGDDLAVYRSSAVPEKVSTPHIDDRLRAAQASISQTQSFAVGIEGHWFYVMNLPILGESYAYDCATKEWARWGSQEAFESGVGPFIGGCSAGQGATIWVGSATDNRVWLLDASNNTDDGMTRAVTTTGAVWITGGTQRLNNVSLACVRGVGNAEAPDPQAWARFSYDGGRTFPTGWLPAQIGPTGAYTYKATWRYLGLFQQPGFLVQFRVLDPVTVVIEGASFNEPRV